MSSANYALSDEPEYLEKGHQLRSTICITFVAYLLLRKTPDCVVLPVNQALLEHPSVLIRPYDSFGTSGGSVSEGKHADVEGMDELEVSSSELCAILFHPSALRPLLESLHGYQFWG